MEYLRDGRVSHEAFNRNGELLEHERFYYPKTQPSSTRKPWTYAQLISEWDKLGFEKHIYIEKSVGDYDLLHYVYNPNNSDKVFLVQAGVHGNEMDSKQELLKIAKMMASGEGTWKNVRNLCKWVFVPCVNPYGHEHDGMNVAYKDVSAGLNLNRNYDFNHQYASASAGVCGEYPFEMPETRHIKYAVDTYKPALALDLHDGESVKQHLWINYCADSPHQNDVDSLVEHLVNKWDIQNPVIDYCGDINNATGVASMWFGKSLGIIGGVNEWMGGYLGYSFDSDMMTKALEVRGNIIRMMAYGDYETEPRKENGFWRWGFAPSATEKGLQKSSAYLPFALSDYYAKWEELQYSSKKSYGMNTNSDTEVFTYTFGSGQKKVLFVGGCMRWNGDWEHTSFAMYIMLREALKGRFGDLLSRYTFVVCPAIDLNGGNTVSGRPCGLNNSALSYGKFSNGAITSYGSGCKDIEILQRIISDNSNASCVISGGERMEGYALNDQTKYSTEYLNHISVPNKLSINLLPNYFESVTIEHTGGDTFGDWCNIPTYYIDRKPDTEVFATRNTDITLDEYSYCNREMAHTITLLLNLIENELQ